MKTYNLNRDVTPTECPWLERTIKYGEMVHEYRGCTYGCIASGIAVTFDPGKEPFFELPRNALTG